MNDSSKTGSDQETVEVELLGGPADLPQWVRVHQSSVAAGKVRIPRYGGYEHFELADPAAAADNAGRLAFRWTMRTRIAE